MSIDRARRQTLGDVLRRTARRVPQRTALEYGAHCWSYAELDDVVDRVALSLHSLGLGTGDRIAILARNSHAFVALRFAIARLGAVLR
jgi:fatty-acyl-CoA synthase